MKKLNIGSGWDYKKGWINLDLNKNFKPDVVHDLDKLPLPFEDNTFDYILCSNVLEHMDNQVALLDELWRICKPGGKIEVHVPHYSHYTAHGDLTHKNNYSRCSFWHYQGIPKYYSDTAVFKVWNVVYKTDALFKGFLKNFIEFFLNQSSMATELIFSKFLPTAQIQFKLEVIK